jgi:thiamine pyridinylase
MKYFLLLIFIGAAFCDSGKGEQQRVDLTATLYPFIPEAEAFYLELEREFEKENPTINLVINPLNLNYYEEDSSGIVADTSDVIELDCIFFEDFLKARKIQPLPSLKGFDTANVLKVGEIAKVSNVWYGVPHWVCSNFLFGTGGDTEIGSAKTFTTFATLFKSPVNITNGVLIDEKGKTNLGELYLDGLYDDCKDIKMVKHVLGRAFDSTLSVVKNMQQIPSLTYKDWGRSSFLHNIPGMYGTLFAKNRGRALVGYSELLHYVFRQRLECIDEDACIDAEKLNVFQFSLSNNGQAPIGWVDALFINSKLKGEKLSAASQFINFLVSKSSYEKALKPALGHAPRFLLPAYKDIYSASYMHPLYQQFYPIAEKLETISMPGLNSQLKVVGKKLDNLIPN